MRKIIVEILQLLWKAARLLFWKWLRPILGRIALVAALALGLVVLVVVLLTRL